MSLKHSIEEIDTIAVNVRVLCVVTFSQAEADLLRVVLRHVLQSRQSHSRDSTANILLPDVQPSRRTCSIAVA